MIMVLCFLNCKTYLFFKMTCIPVLPLDASLFVEGNIAHVYYAGNTGERRDVIEYFKSRELEKKFVIGQMDCLAEGTLKINHSTDGIDTEKEHRSLCEELKEVKEKEFHDEWIIRGVLHEMRMGLLAGYMEPFEEYTTVYSVLDEEFKKIDEKDSRDEMLLHALDILNLEKIYVYE